MRWLLPSLTMAAVLGSAGSAAAESDGCKSVKGKFESQTVPPPACTSPVGVCTEGELNGGLAGSYQLTVQTLQPSGDPRTPTVQFATGTSEITLKDGRVLVGADAGALNLGPPGTVGSGSASLLLTFTEGAAGWLHILGQLDLATGTVTGRYEGYVCFEDA